MHAVIVHGIENLVKESFGDLLAVFPVRTVDKAEVNPQEVPELIVRKTVRILCWVVLQHFRQTGIPINFTCMPYDRFCSYYFFRSALLRNIFDVTTHLFIFGERQRESCMTSRDKFFNVVNADAFSGTEGSHQNLDPIVREMIVIDLEIDPEKLHEFLTVERRLLQLIKTAPSYEGTDFIHAIGH